jgi:hypothetical protein
MPALAFRAALFFLAGGFFLLHAQTNATTEAPAPNPQMAREMKSDFVSHTRGSGKICEGAGKSSE